MRIRSIVLTSVALVASAAVLAEQMYVEDKLVLNVYADADQSSARVATIETGDSVEALERVENYVHVQLEDGREGWVGANYLSTQPPAIVRLKELQSAQSAAEAPNKRLTDELARLKKQNATLQAELADLKKKASAPAAPAAAVAPPVAAPVDESENALDLPPPAAPVVVERNYCWAWLLAIALAASSGFAGGYQMLGRRVRARFGGVKVY